MWPLKAVRSLVQAGWISPTQLALGLGIGVSYLDAQGRLPAFLPWSAVECLVILMVVSQLLAFEAAPTSTSKNKFNKMSFIEEAYEEGNVNIHVHPGCIRAVARSAWALSANESTLFIVIVVGGLSTVTPFARCNLYTV